MASHDFNSVASKWREDAQKYQDTSALLLVPKERSRTSVCEERENNFKFTLTPEDSKVIYTQSLTPALSYHLGLQVEEKRAGRIWAPLGAQSESHTIRRSQAQLKAATSPSHGLDQPLR